MKSKGFNLSNNIWETASIFILILLIFSILKHAIGVSFYSNIYALASSIQDDSFYYIIPAFNFAHSKGFSFGGELSYGFQPVYELLLSFFALFTETPQQLLRISLFLNSLLFTGTGIFIFLSLIRGISNLNTKNFSDNKKYIFALLGAFIYMSNSWNYFDSFTAKENALAAFIFSLIIFLILDKNISKNKIFIIGFLIGVLTITRIAISTLLYIPVLLWFFRHKYKRFILGLLIAPIIWFIFAKLYFGNFIPYSALVKASVPSLPLTKKTLIQAWNYFIVAIKFGSYGPSKVILPQPNWQDALRDETIKIGIYAILAVSLISLLFRYIKYHEKTLQILIFLLFANLIGTFFMGLSLALKRPLEIYYASWYLYDQPVIMSLVIGFGTYSLYSFISKKFYIKKFFVTFVVAVISYYSIVTIKKYIKIKPYTYNDYTVGIEKSWQNTMIAAGLWYKENTPGWKNNIVAAYSSGALNFVLEDTVINLDGLSNNSAAISLLKTGNIKSYILQKKPDYFIDIASMYPKYLKNNLEIKKLFKFSYGGYLVGKINWQTSKNSR